MSDSWPAWATARAEQVAADPDWERVAAVLAADLEVRLAAWLDGGVEHVGSTAMPSLAAKPVIDLMAPVVVLAACPQADAPLGQAGWQLVPPELDGRPWRRFYVLPRGARRMAHLHLVERASSRWRETLAFRDALRASPEVAADYARLKRDAAATLGDDREAYTHAKTAFVRRILAERG